LKPAGGINCGHRRRKTPDLTIAIRRLGWRGPATTKRPSPGRRLRKTASPDSSRPAFPLDLRHACNPSGSMATRLLRPKYGTLRLDRPFRTSLYFQLVLPLIFSQSSTSCSLSARCLGSGSWRKVSGFTRAASAFGPPLTWKNRSSFFLGFFCSSTYSRAWWPSPWSTRKTGTLLFPVLLQRFLLPPVDVTVVLFRSVEGKRVSGAPRGAGRGVESEDPPPAPKAPPKPAPQPEGQN